MQFSKFSHLQVGYVYQKNEPIYRVAQKECNDFDQGHRQ